MRADMQDVAAYFAIKNQRSCCRDCVQCMVTSSMPLVCRGSHAPCSKRSMAPPGLGWCAFDMLLLLLLPLLLSLLLLHVLDLHATVGFVHLAMHRPHTFPQALHCVCTHAQDARWQLHVPHFGQLRLTSN